ncbi:GAF domain-containing protein [Thermodesulfobacteriota bacterium]
MEEILKDYPFRCVLSLKPLIEYLDQTALVSWASTPGQTGDLREMLKQAPELNEPIEDLTVLETHRDLVRRLMSLVFPAASWETEAFGALVPFSITPFFVSPLYERLFLREDGTFQGRLNVDQQDYNRGRIIRAYLLILERFYGIKQSLEYPFIRIVPDPNTGLDRHFKMRIDFRFVEARAVTEPKILTDEEREWVHEHLAEPEILREVLPPENFELRGFTIGQAVDVTESEIISALERDLIDQESIVSQGGFLRIQDRLRTLFRRPELVAGLEAIQEDQVLQLSSGCEMSHCCIYADTRHIPISEFEGTVYERAIQGEQVLRVPDVLQECSPKHTKEELHQMGVRSLLIAPLRHKDKCIGILHLGSPKPGDLGPTDALFLSQVQPLFSLAIKRALEDFDNRVQGLIKEKCTAIHPSVEWRFRKAAFHYLEDLRVGKASEIETIVFKDVYPLYGVSDIRGSTVERNRAIQQDLTEHLRLAQNVIDSANEARPMLILRELAQRIDGYLERIRTGLGTGDDLSVVNFLRQEVESVFTHLRGFGLKVIRAIETYESAMDPNVGAVYGLRKQFEESVSILNDRLTSYLDQEESEVQGLFPHYFERHRTDGVDYLIYTGTSLTEQGEFNQLYLKNLRLWQIKVACGMAWHTEQLKPSLKVPLDTAHLILMQNSPLSIRFRFDEKRFDVDGAYDIRQEIIKSRLDKAAVKGGKRLTQPGKIAIVYSHPEEAEEIRRHVDFLRSEGYLTQEAEDLQLEEMSGVQGLRSLRVGVSLDSQALSESAGRLAG